ncbi:MAG: DNA polymerase III subunit delta' [Candidatus Omnitrophica bacterium]|nr:DNA polymerase III subunit delta' [Candidatus Omnitrophota bacterium]
MNTASVDEKILERFRRLWASGRMGHAYLLVGPKEAGKTETALAVAKLVNCESSATKPCTECPSCRKIESGNHPDVMILQEEEGSIKIDQIRFLLGRLQLKAFEAKTKVFIIRHVETMTLEAANSLLKTLEEPASHTLMILTTAVPEANLDTIRSRCHVVKFFPSSRRRLQEVLGKAQPMAQFLAVYSDGCLGQARQLAQEDFIRRKNQILDGFLHKSHEDFFKKSSSQKEEAVEALHIFLSIIRDAILLKTGVPADELMHTDRLADVRSLAGRSFEDLSAIYEQVVNTKELLDENLNAKMAFSILRQKIWDN